MTQSTDAMPADVRAALDRLQAILKKYGSMAVAYSGGVDSCLLAYCAHRTLGESALAVIGISPSLSRRERELATGFLEGHGIPFAGVETEELASDAYTKNHPDRCYHCKNELFLKLRSIARSHGLEYVAYGANADDAADYRPGGAAALDHGVVAPLAEVGMGKEMIRRLAHALSLDVWDKPASPCLASRIPYYSAVDVRKLEQIERAEDALKDLGFSVCRVRHHGDVAKIELLHSECGRVFEGDLWKRIADRVKEAGFSYVTLDVEGFRSGRLNEVLERSNGDEGGGS